MSGTSDAESEQCNALRPATERYAFSYNRRIVALLGKPR